MHVKMMADVDGGIVSRPKGSMGMRASCRSKYSVSARRGRAARALVKKAPAGDGEVCRRRRRPAGRVDVKVECRLVCRPRGAGDGPAAGEGVRRLRRRLLEEKVKWARWSSR